MWKIENGCTLQFRCFVVSLLVEWLALFEFDCLAFFLKGYYWKGMAHFANEKYIESSECFITALSLTSDDNLKYSTTMKILHGRVKSGNYYWSYCIVFL